MDLKNDEGTKTGGNWFGMFVTSLSMYAYYSVDENSYGKESRIDAYGRYSHAKENVSTSMSFSISLGGIGFSFSGASSTSFDIQKNTQATMSI